MRWEVVWREEEKKTFLNKSTKTGTLDLAVTSKIKETLRNAEHENDVGQSYTFVIKAEDDETYFSIWLIFSVW